MNSMHDERLEEYYEQAESWSVDRQRSIERSVRLAWIAAGVAALIAVVEAFALFALIPLKREVPYTLLVDRQTGFVQALKPLESSAITADDALTRSFLVQYVIARENFDIDSLQESYRKVGLWSTGEARDRYMAGMSASNPLSPLARLPRRATIDVAIRSVSSLSANTALVRFSTTRTDPGGRPQIAENWQAIVSYRYSEASMTAEDRLTNPLGFQVTRYRRDAETLPETVEQEAPAALPAATPVAPVAPASRGKGEPEAVL